MHDAIQTMMDRYDCSSRDQWVNAVREILQNIALLGLWRSKFFEHAAFYGGSALRILHGLDRFSEDLDFSLLAPQAGFSLETYGESLKREVTSFGFTTEFERREKTGDSAIESAFLKANTYEQLIVVGVEEDMLRDLHPRKKLKIKLEVDTDPPGEFETDTHYVLQPIPFAVRTYRLSDLLAGKLHAVLCRKWKTRVKGRDWYDLVWFAGRHPEVHLAHLEERMRQSGDYADEGRLTSGELQTRLLAAVEELDVDMARAEVAPFVRRQEAIEVWSKDFFADVVTRIVVI